MRRFYSVSVNAYAVMMTVLFIMYIGLIAQSYLLGVIQHAAYIEPYLFLDKHPGISLRFSLRLNQSVNIVSMVRYLFFMY